MTQEQNKVLGLLGDVYDAALAPELWPETLCRIAEATGATAAALVSIDTAQAIPRDSFAFGTAPDTAALFSETRIQGIAKVGEPCELSALMPDTAWRESRLWREWACPAGYGETLGVLVERTSTMATVLVVAFCREARMPVSAPAQIASLAPHLGRALAIARAIEASRAEASALGDAIDALGAAVYLLRCDGAVMRANSRGRELARAGDLVACTADGRLSVVDEGERRELRQAVAASAAHGRGAAIPLASRSGERYVADVLPLRAAGTSAVFVHKTDDPIFPLDTIARSFGLSKAEQRVLDGIIEIGPPCEIAAALGLSQATVRTHLRRLFEKTGTSRQADLVKLVAGYAGPVAATRARTVQPCRV